jgi:hypothetical protein
MRRALLAAAVVLLAACRSADSPPSTFAPPVTNASTGPSVNEPAPSTTPTSTVTPPWTVRRYAEVDALGAQRPCVEVTIAAAVASTCLALPGVSSWTVAGTHFVVAASDIALTDGSVIRADASGLAIGVLPPRAVPSTDPKDACTRDALAPAVADHYPGTAVAWVPNRCTPGAAAVSATLADGSEVIALAAQANDGHWEVFATFRPPVHCALLDVRSRDVCKLLRFAD